MGRDPYGHVYIGAGNISTYDAALYQYNAEQDSFKIVGTIKAASQAANNWLSLDKPGKIHSKIHFSSNGKMYFATHSSDEGTDYSGFRGGHLYSYDIATGVTKDESAPDVLIPNNGIMDCPVAPSFNLVYAVGYPDGDLYIHDLTSGVSTLLGPSGSKQGSVSRYMFTDNSGRLFYPRTNYFYCYNPATKSASFKAVNKIQGVTQISCLVKTLGGDTIYFIPHGTYNIYEYIPATDQVTDLGLANPDSSNTPVRGMVMRWDLKKLYYLPDVSRTLVEFDIPTRTKKVLSAAPYMDYTGSDGVDKNGDIYFCCYGSCGYVYKFYLNTPCTVCSTFVSPNESQPVEPLSDEPLLTVQPNPLTSGGIIRTSSMGSRFYSLTLFDLSGRLVRTWSEASEGSERVIRWNGLDKHGRPLQSGVYILRLTVNQKTRSQTITVIR